jgi:hypothetical protein
MILRLRGLLNSGNMCFANAVNGGVLHAILSALLCGSASQTSLGLRCA